MSPSGPSITIAPAGPDDIPRVQRLAETIWRRHYPGIIPAEQIEYMLATMYAHAALLPFTTAAGRGLAIAREDGAAVGFAAWCRDDAPQAMKLDKLYVLPERHGMGIGHLLLDHVIARATDAGCSSLTLNVNRNNSSAIRAYLHWGFAIRDRGDFPIGGGFVMADFIMIRDIGSSSPTVP